MPNLWRVGLAALSVLLAGAASAAAVTKVGVMSVLGGEIQLVIRAPTTGTRVDRNAKESLKAEGFEKFVLLTTVDAVRREGLGEALVLARPANGSMPWQRDGQAVLVTRPLLQAAQAAGLSHLLLIQPARAEAKLQMFRTATGAGQLEGLGFYIDTALPVQNVSDNEWRTGFLAPYAYFDMYLVDVATLDLQAEHRARASIATSDAGRQANDAWQALSNERKVEVLQHLIREEVDKALHEWALPKAPAR
ncbi:MAG: hypothetical protein EOP35_01005 [Rubrivivax sp.]|nr:MAG: hypothetical protein EOP35_01005 [Rubrivivax sp.]